MMQPSTACLELYNLQTPFICQSCFYNCDLHQAPVDTLIVGKLFVFLLKMPCLLEVLCMAASWLCHRASVGI